MNYQYIQLTSYDIIINFLKEIIMHNNNNQIHRGQWQKQKSNLIQNEIFKSHKLFCNKRVRVKRIATIN